MSENNVFPPSKKPTWSGTLARHPVLFLPAAHDALAARLIERAGFPAYQVGGLAMVGAMHAVPDIDLEHFGEKIGSIENVVRASSLPVLVDADDGYGDAKNVARTVKGYELLGAQAIFIEDQKAPKRCGHMAGKEVIPPDDFVKKLRSAVETRDSKDFFIIARTDAIGAESLDSALRRGECYLRTGVDALYFEGPCTEKDIEKIGASFKGVPLATSVMEQGGKTPFLSMNDFEKLGFSMILFPGTVIFSVAKAIEQALQNLRDGHPVNKRTSFTMDQFLDIVNSPCWQKLEERMDHS